MKRYLPLLLILTYLVSPSPVLGAAAQPEPVGTIDTENPAWGEDIVIEKEIRAGSSPNLGTINVGPETGQVQFPNFEQLTKEASGALQFLLPENLRASLDLPDPKSLIGQIFHPICDIRRKDGGEIQVDQTPRGGTTVATPDYWTTLLGATQLVQALGVPGFSSGVRLVVPEGQKIEDSVGNAPLLDCPPIEGEVQQEQKIQAVGTTEINLGLFDTLVNFLQNLIGSLLPGEKETIQITVKPKKLIPGENAFAEQTSSKLGFLRSFCPESLCPNKINEKNPTGYRISGGQSNKSTYNLEFQGAWAAKEGYNLLVKSLYPEGLQSLIVPNRDGASFPYPPRTGDVLDFTIPYMDSRFVISDERKQRIITQVLTNWPNSKIQDFWNTVVSESIASGVNPAFTLAIWIEESGAGGVPAQSEFGCFPGGDTSQTVSFELSLGCFLHFTANEHPNSFPEWVRYFCGPKAEPICSNNQGFITRLKFWWEKFVK